MMNVNYLEKLQEQEKVTEKAITSLEKQRDTIDEQISDLNRILHEVHRKATDELFGAKE